jgi:thioesterase domain-containing protein
LIGHSFGGRVVTAAAAALDPGTPAVTMTLLQAAYSHNGLAARFDGEHDGFFRTVLAQRRISGPVVITHTKNDKAVGIAYPLASRIAHDKAAALGDANDPYGGMGRNGAQHTAEVAATPKELLDLGQVQATPYQLQPGAVYNLNADRFISGHSDICNHQVACAILGAVGSI